MRREDVIGKKRPVPVTKATVPVLGEIYLRKLSAADSEKCADILREKDGRPVNWQARLAVMLIADENGNRVFTDADANELGSDPALADAISAACEAGDKFNERNTDAAKKNLETTPPES